MNEITIEAGHAERVYWRDLWRYRELFCFLAWRDLLVRYKQTVIGISWAVLRPLLTMFVLTLIFGKLAKMDSGGVPYPILVFCGMLPWQFFATAFAESGNSLVANAGMISKVYFPRLVIPASSVMTSFVDFMISSFMMGVLFGYYRYMPSSTIAFLPIFILLACSTALGIGIWVSALMVRYRDFRYIVPFMVQFGLYLSPVGFSSSVVPDVWRPIYSLNPMVGVIDGFRWSILSEYNPYWLGFIFSALGSTFMLVTGIWYFRKTERTFADVI